MTNWKTKQLQIEITEAENSLCRLKKNLVYIKIPRHNFQTMAPKAGIPKYLKASMVFIHQLHQFNTGTLLQETPGGLHCFFL